MYFKIQLLSFLVAFAALSNSWVGQTKEKVPLKPNVLFIIKDDLADWIRYLEGYLNVLTPNIDRLASREAVFLNAHELIPEN